MDKNDVEELLDLKVKRGRMTPERKEEMLREYDARLREMQQGGEKLIYPRIEKQGIMSVPEMIITVVLAIALCVAAKEDIKWLLLVLAGALFVIAPFSTLLHMLKNNKRNE